MFEISASTGLDTGPSIESRGLAVSRVGLGPEGTRNGEGETMAPAKFATLFDGSSGRVGVYENFFAVKKRDLRADSPELEAGVGDEGG